VYSLAAVLRSKLDRIRALRAAVAEDPLDLGKRWLLAEAYPLDNPHDEPEAGRWIRLAIAELQRILEIQERTPGVSGLDRMRTRSRIAGHREYLGELSPAELDANREDEAAVCEAELGPIHPRTLEALERVRSCRPAPQRPGLTERILTGWEQALADHLRRLGPDHPDTLEVRFMLSAACRTTRPDDFEEQQAEYLAGWDRVIAERTRRLGPVHPDTVRARKRRAVRTGVPPLAALAGELERIVADSERLLGEDDPRTLRLRADLVGTLRFTDEPRALALAEQLIDRIYDLPEPDHDDVGSLRSIIAVHRGETGGDEAFNEVLDRFRIPADDDEDLYPGDPGYPGTDDEFQEVL
jgi:hypothetical protein